MLWICEFLNRTICVGSEHAEIFDHPDACAELILAVTVANSNRLADPGKLLNIVTRVKCAGVSQELAKALDERMLMLGIT